VDLLCYAFTALRVLPVAEGRANLWLEAQMTDSHDPQYDPADSMRELVIRLLFEEGQEKQEALVEELARMVKAQKGQPGCLIHLPGA
jgi:hypothetical protein